MKTVKETWEEYTEYTLVVQCPYCKETIDWYDFDSVIDEGQKVDVLVKCIYCYKEFKLKIEEA